MNEHEQLIHKFYSAFQQLDVSTMMECYHEEATFKDPVFELINKGEINAMWSLLCSNAKKFEMHFHDIELTEQQGSVKLKATYLFSQTNRMVENHIEAKFRFKNGLIVEHRDSFDFWKWSRQALGMPGYFLGWSSFLKNKVRRGARKNLTRYASRAVKQQ